jgi:quercetin dioxygenase-like cupin family protein
METNIPIASFLPADAANSIASVDVGRLPIEMHASDATALELVSSKDGNFGADLIRFPAGGSVPMHTHPGAHILIVIGGKGKLITHDAEASLNPGVVYLVPGGVSHEIFAETALSLISVSDQRIPPSSPDRLALCLPI